MIKGHFSHSFFSVKQSFTIASETLWSGMCFVVWPMGSVLCCVAGPWGLCFVWWGLCFVWWDLCFVVWVGSVLCCVVCVKDGSDHLCFRSTSFFVKFPLFRRFLHTDHFCFRSSHSVDRILLFYDSCVAI